MERPILRPNSRYIYNEIEVRYVGKRGIEHVFCPEDFSNDIGNGQGRGKAFTDEEISQLKPLFVPTRESQEYARYKPSSGDVEKFKQIFTAAQKNKADYVPIKCTLPRMHFLRRLRRMKRRTVKWSSK